MGQAGIDRVHDKGKMTARERIEFLLDDGSFVEVDALGETQKPIVITQNEWMRRMKEMSQLQAGMSFYGEMPDSYGMVLNSDNALIIQSSKVLLLADTRYLWNLSVNFSSCDLSRMDTHSSPHIRFHVQSSLLSFALPT